MIVFTIILTFSKFSQIFTRTGDCSLQLDTMQLSSGTFTGWDRMIQLLLKTVNKIMNNHLIDIAIIYFLFDQFTYTASIFMKPSSAWGHTLRLKELSQHRSRSGAMTAQVLVNDDVTFLSTYLQIRLLLKHLWWFIFLSSIQHDR